LFGWCCAIGIVVATRSSWSEHWRKYREGDASSRAPPGDEGSVPADHRDALVLCAVFVPMAFLTRRHRYLL